MTAPTILLYDGDTEYDISDQAYALSIRRGRSRSLDTFPPGTCVINLRNYNRDFDPSEWVTDTGLLLQENDDALLQENTDNILLEYISPGAGAYGTIRSGMKLIVKHGATTVFTGYVEDWDYTWDADKRALASLTALDPLAILGNTDLVEYFGVADPDTGVKPVLPEERGTVGQRILNVLGRDGVDYPIPDDYDYIFTGNTDLLQADTVSFGTNCLAYIQQIVLSVTGRFFARRDGLLQYLHRHSVLPYQVATSATFSDTGTDIDIAGVSITYGSEELHFGVSAQRAGGRAVERLASSNPSATTLGLRMLTMSGLLLECDAASEAMAEWLLTRYSNQQAYVSELLVKMESLSSGNQTTVAGLEIGDLIDLTWTPTGVGDTITEVLVIEGIGYSASYDDVTMVTLQLSPAPSDEWLILNDATYGVLDLNKIGY